MSLLNDSKVTLIRKETVDRFKESPGSVDEALLMLLDHSTATPLREIYQRLGENEHPVFCKDSWISDAAARVTVEGYWEWVKSKVESGGYRVSGGYVGRASSETTQFATATVAVAPTLPFPQMPMPAAPVPPMPTLETAARPLSVGGSLDGVNLAVSGLDFFDSPLAVTNS